MAKNETVSQIIGTLCSALLKDESTLSNRERELLAGVFQHVEKDNIISPEFNDIVTQKITKAVRSVVVERVLGTIQSAVVEHLFEVAVDLSPVLLLSSTDTTVSVNGDNSKDEPAAEATSSEELDENSAEEAAEFAESVEIAENLAEALKTEIASTEVSAEAETLDAATELLEEVAEKEVAEAAEASLHG